MFLVQKIIRGLTTQIENQFKSMNEMYRYSTQNKPCFSNIIFSNLPNLTNSSCIIDDILMANTINIGINDDSIKDDKLGTGKLIFEHFLDYTVNCFDQIFFDFYSKDKSHDDSENKQKKRQEIISFFDLVRFNFYSSILSVLTSKNNINSLVFSSLMYSSFLKKFPDFLTNNITLALEIKEYDISHPLYIHGYYSIQNVFNSLSRFNIDIFKDYLNENDSKGRGLNISKLCDAAILLVQNKESLLSFTKDLAMMLGLSSSSIERNDFLGKLYQFFFNLFITNTDLYIDIIQSNNDEIITNLHNFFLQILDLYHIDINSSDLTMKDLSTSESNNVLPISSFLLPFLFRISNFEKYKNFVFVNFKSLLEKIKNSPTKEIIFDYLNSFIALYQAVLLIPDSKQKIKPIFEFINSNKSNFDNYLFKFDIDPQIPSNDDSSSSSNSTTTITSLPNPRFEVINSSMFLFNILPRYLALDIAKASIDYNEKDESSYAITQSVSFCTQTSNIYFSISLIRGLQLLIKGYPYKNASTIEVQIILNIIFNIVDMYKNPSSRSTSLIPTSSFSTPSISSGNTNSITSSNSSSPVTQSPNLLNFKAKEVSYTLETVDHLHRDVYELISGHTFYGSGIISNEYDLIHTFIDLIATESSTTLALYRFMINEVRTNILKEAKRSRNFSMNVSDFSADTITSFFILLNTIFSKPSRWIIFTLESTNTNRYLNNVNTALYKLYKDLLKKNITALFCFDTTMIKYLKFAREIIKMSKTKVNVEKFIDDVEKILLLMNATSDLTNSELANKELQKLADEFHVNFLYQWPLQFNPEKSSHNDLIIQNNTFKISSEKQKNVKDNVFLPIMKFCYLFWFESTFLYLYKNNFIVNIDNSSQKVTSIVGWKIKSNVSFQIIIRITSFLCRYSNLIDEIQPLLQKRGIFKTPKIKFANALFDFVSHDIKDEVSLLISNSVSLFDNYTSNMLLKIIRSNLLSSMDSFSFSTTFISLIPNGNSKFKSESNLNSCLCLHSNCYLFISELINEDSLFYNDQSYIMCEEIILNLIAIISMDSKFKSNNIDENSMTSIKSILYSISNIIYKFYGFDRKDAKSSQIARLSIISTILNYMISTQNSMFSVIIAKPLPRLFKDFVITAENEISGSISNYENILFIRKTIDNFFSFFFLILSSNDKSSLFSVCQESLENILLANYEETVDIFVTSTLKYSKGDNFTKVILKSLISVIKKSPQTIKYSPYLQLRDEMKNNTFSSIIRSNVNSIYFYEAIIEAASYSNKLRQLFILMCKQYHHGEMDDSTFYEKINCPFFFIAFFKLAATNSFIKSFSVSLFKMSVEKTTENLLPPIQFVYYWQLFCKLTDEDPYVVLDKFFIRPILLQPHLYDLNPNLTVKNGLGTSNTIFQFITKLQSYSGLKIYLDHLMKDQVEYCEFYPFNSNKLINSHSVLFHFFSQIPNPGNFVNYSNIKMSNNLLEMNKHDLDRNVFEFIQSQCLVCIDKDRKMNKNWLLNLDKIPENSIQIIHECFRVLISKSIEEQNSKKNEFSCFYEESPLNLNQKSLLNCSTDSLLPNKQTKSENKNESDTNQKKRKFSKSFFKHKIQITKKEKDEEKNKSKKKDNENNNDQNELNSSFLSQINLYINMRKLPSNYLNILDTIFDEKINSINLIFTPIGILHEIENEIINKKTSNLDHIKIISNIDKEKDLIVPIHISTTKIQCNCQVNNNIGSIGFFQECIIISSFEQFRNQQYQVSTVCSYAQYKLPKIISKTAIEIEFQFDKNYPQSTLITNIQGNKNNTIILDFDLGSSTNNNNKSIGKISPEFIFEAMQSSTGSTIGDQKVSALPPSFNADPTIALIALSLFYIPNVDSNISEAALELFWLVIESFSSQKKNKEIISNSSSSSSNLISNSLNLPPDGFIRVLQGINHNNGCQETTLFSSVVQYLSNFLPIPKKENMQMMPFLTLTSAFISTSNDQSVLSGICHNLLRQFSDENSIIDLTSEFSGQSSMNDYFQFLQIWSTVRSNSFTTIALPQILIYVSNSVCQSQLIHCLTAKNRKVVNDVLIENLLYKDLISYRLYSPICSDGLFNIFPLIQFLGKPDIILFLNLVAALTASQETVKPFFDSIKSFLLYYQKNKQMISQADDFNDQFNDGLINDEINDDEISNNIYITSSKSNSDSFTDLDFSLLFDPEQSNLYNSTKRVLSFLDQNLQDSIFNHFENLSKTENLKICHLKPSLSTTELLDAMTDSIVPELNLRKLNFCLASFFNHKSDTYRLFWVALPYLLSQHSYLRRISANFIASIFSNACKKNDEDGDVLIDPFDEFIKVLEKSKNLLFLMKTFGEVIGVNFEENLLVAFASLVLDAILQDEKNKLCMFRLLYIICSTYKKKPSKAICFLLILIVFTNKISVNFIRKFNINFSSEGNSFSEFFKEISPSLSRFETLWILNFLVWAYSQPYPDKSRYQAKVLFLITEILKLRNDLPKIFKKELISKFLKLTDSKDQNVQEYLASIFAIANSSTNEEGNNTEINPNSQKSSVYCQLEKLLWIPKTNNLVEQHLHSFCVNIHAAIKCTIDKA